MNKVLACVAAASLGLSLLAPSVAAAATNEPAPGAGVATSQASTVEAVVTDLPARLNRGATVEIGVSTAASLAGSVVRLERRLAPDGAWHTAGSGNIDDAGDAVLSAKPNSYRTFDFRVVVDADARLVSREQSVEVVASGGSDGVTVTDATATDTVPADSDSTAAGTVVVDDLPATLTKGSTLTLTVSTDATLAGTTARLERRLAPSGGWATVRTASLDAAGAAVFDAKPNSFKTFDFRVVVDAVAPLTSRVQQVTVVTSADSTDGTVSPPSGGDVTADPSIEVGSLPAKLNKGATLAVTVTAAPTPAGTTVSLQRRVAPSGTWSSVGSAVLDAESAARFTIKPNSYRTFQFRVALGTDPLRVSRTQSVTVVKKGGSTGITPPKPTFVPTAGALFNNPFGSRSVKHRISKRIEDAINATPTGETIRLAMYSFGRPQSLTAVLAAHNRGVRMQVVLNDHDLTSEIIRLRQVLGTDPTKPSFVTVCVDGCRMAAGNQHMKFVAFSKTGETEKALMVTSGNLTGAAGAWQWNDMLTVLDRPTLYKNFTEIFDELAQDRPVPTTYRYVSDGPYTAEFFPVAKSKANDPVWRELSKVKCWGATGGAGIGGRTVIQATAWTWRGTRGMYLAERLRELDNQGCIVQVVVGAPNRYVLRELRRMGPYGGIQVRDSRQDFQEVGYYEQPSFTKGTHMKYLLINGAYGDDASYKKVLTGSLNWTDGALAAGDEVVLQHEDAATHSSYVANFSTMFKNRTYTTVLRNY